MRARGAERLAIDLLARSLHRLVPAEHRSIHALGAGQIFAIQRPGQVILREKVIRRRHLGIQDLLGRSDAAVVTRIGNLLHRLRRFFSAALLLLRRLVRRIVEHVHDPPFPLLHRRLDRRRAAA